MADDVNMAALNTTLYCSLSATNSKTSSKSKPDSGSQSCQFLQHVQKARKKAVVTNKRIGSCRNSLTLEQQKQLCQYKLEHPNAYAKDIYKHFRNKWPNILSCSNISKILGKSNILLKSGNNRPKYRFNIYHSRHKRLEAAVFLWYMNFSSKQSITKKMLADKAQEVANELNLTHFRCSKKWLESFSNRHSIPYAKCKDDLQVKILNIDLDYEVADKDVPVMDKVSYVDSITEGTIRVLAPITRDEAQKGMMTCMAYLAENQDMSIKSLDPLWDVLQCLLEDSQIDATDEYLFSPQILDHQGQPNTQTVNLNDEINTEESIKNEQNVNREIKPDDHVEWIIQSKTTAAVPFIRVIQPIDPSTEAEMEKTDSSVESVCIKREMDSVSDSGSLYMDGELCTDKCDGANLEAERHRDGSDGVKIAGNDIPIEHPVALIKSNETASPSSSWKEAHVCGQCGMLFPVASDVYAHQIDAHSSQVESTSTTKYYCQACDIVFKQASDFGRHININHIH